LTEGLRREAGPPLRVTGVSPDMTHTDLASNSIEDPGARAEIEAAMTMAIKTRSRRFQTP